MLWHGMVLCGMVLAWYNEGYSRYGLNGRVLHR
jgi:hypothetical protein